MSYQLKVFKQTSDYNNEIVLIQDDYNYTKSRINVMSWYNAYSDNTRKLQQLIESKPTLEQLLEFPEFLQLLKAYQPKVLEYISNSYDIPRQMLKYITHPPIQTDSDSRKYRLPLLTVMMIETNTICVINSFFKIDPITRKPFFINAFEEFMSAEQELLPLLCGYFSQMNIILWNNRYKEVVDLVYDFKEPLLLLVNHTYSKAIVNTLLLYLNLDLTRNPNIQPERAQIKLQIIRILYDQIRGAFEASKKDEGKNERNEIIVDNICDVLIQIVDKYYLIADGKNMLDCITTQENIELIMDILMYKKEISYSVVSLAMVLMRYYCLSSFNQEDPSNADHSKKNQERLESQPFIKKIGQLIPIVSQELFKTNNFSLYHSRLLEVFLPTIELSSKKLSDTIKASHFFQNLIALLFKWPQLSIVHKQIQRTFFAVFCSERRVCQQYRKFLFCQAGLIEKTAGQCLNKIDKLGEAQMKLGWFAHLMKIVKIYSKVQTNDQQVNSAIMQRAALWERFSTSFMRPFDALCFKDLGSYEGLPDRTAVEYSVRSVSGGLGAMPPTSKKILEELIQEQSMQHILTTMPQKNQEAKSSSLSQDALFVVQDFQRAPEMSQSKGPQILITNHSPTTGQTHIIYQSQHRPQDKPIVQQNQPSTQDSLKHPQESLVKQAKKQEVRGKTFDQYLSVKKQEITTELALQRKSSSQKRLSANKSRVTSPSPKKKKWDDNKEVEQEHAKLTPATKAPQPQIKKQKLSLTSPSLKPPLIPQTPKSPRIAQQEVKQPHYQKQTKTEQRKLEDTVVTSISSINERITKSVSFEENRSVTEIKSGVSEIQQIKMMMSKSALNLSELKNVQFKRQRVLKPVKSEFRKVDAKDKVFLQFLGVKI